MFQLSITPDRWKVVDFAYPHRITPLTFVLTMPIAQANSSFLYQIFQPYVWLLSIITMFIIFFLLRQFGNSKNIKKFRFWNMIEILFHQKFNHNWNKKNIISLVILCWVVVCTTLTMFYTNCLYSYMIIISDVGIINTIDLLLQVTKSNEILIFALSNDFNFLKVSLINNFYSGGA